MSNNWMICRSAATLGAEPLQRTQSACSVWEPDEDVPRPTATRLREATNGATLALVITEPQAEDIDVPIVQANRRTEWFRGPVAQLPKRTPHISPALLALAVEDE